MSDPYGQQRRKAILDINALYPIDSQFGTTNAIGADLLVESILEYGWKKLPTDLLFIYAEKCRQRVQESGD